MRTYSGHSTAKASNQLYRTNLAKGQTGLSIAFDLPTQIGYDPDSPEAAGEVGKVGVPVAHLGHMAQLLDQIPVESMNTSMTINATAGWLLGLYIANAEDHGVDPRVLSGTTQNDIVKEYLSRGTFIFPPLPSRRLTVDTIAYTVRHVPKWNPINVCSYHLQEAGATPHQEVAYALATAIGVLDAVRESGQIPDAEFPSVVGRISFFVNAGVRFVEETCKMRAFTALWDRVCSERYGVTDPKLRRMRYGVQVNSLGLTEAQPENNVPRIVLESLGRHPVQAGPGPGPAAAGLERGAGPSPPLGPAVVTPHPADPGLRVRPAGVRRHLRRLGGHREEDGRGGRGRVGRAGGCAGPGRGVRGHRRAQVPPGGQPGRPGASHRDRRAPGGRRQLLHRDRRVSALPRGRGRRFGWLHPAGRPGRGVRAARRRGGVAGGTGQRRRRPGPSTGCKRAAEGTENIMPATIALAHAGGTTGEWAGALRQVFGEYRAPTGVSGGVGHRGSEFRSVLSRSKAMAERTGGPPKLLVAKPGLDGHSNGAEQIAVAARDAGFEVVYQGIRLSPAEIAAAARDEDVDVVGISILSGSHLELVPEVVDRLRAAGVDAPVVVGGIIPPEDAEILLGKGVARVYTPKDFEIGQIMDDMLGLAEEHRATPVG